jgi:hypothetical protein
MPASGAPSLRFKGGSLDSNHRSELSGSSRSRFADISPMLQQLRHAVRAIRERGFRFLWVYFRESLWFDLRHGTRTSTRVPKSGRYLRSLGERDDGVLYVASFTSVTKQSLQAARRILGAEAFARAQFVDLGCGKGKPLLIYAQLYPNPGLPAIGIEYDTALVEVARANLAACEIEPRMAMVVADSASNVRQHVSGEVLIVYLYNPFQGSTLRTVLSTLAATPHLLIYVDPVERATLLDGGYQLIEDHPGRYHADTWLIATHGLS